MNCVKVDCIAYLFRRNNFATYVQLVRLFRARFRRAVPLQDAIGRRCKGSDPEDSIRGILGR